MKFLLSRSFSIKSLMIRPVSAYCKKPGRILPVAKGSLVLVSIISQYSASSHLPTKFSITPLNVLYKLRGPPPINDIENSKSANFRGARESIATALWPP